MLVSVDVGADHVLAVLATEPEFATVVQSHAEELTMHELLDSALGWHLYLAELLTIVLIALGPIATAPNLAISAKQSKRLMHRHDFDCIRLCRLIDLRQLVDVREVVVVSSDRSREAEYALTGWELDCGLLTTLDLHSALLATRDRILVVEIL